MIPKEAIEAALEAWCETPMLGDALMNALEAAAPYLRAQALEDAADEADERVAAIEQTVVEEWMYDALCAMREQATQDAAWLRARAVTERGEPRD